MTTGHAGGKPCILTHGSDAALLSTRRWVLQAGGFEVVVSGTEAETESLLRNLPDLLLVCHSLSKHAQECALAMAARLSPATQRLLMTLEPMPRSDASRALCHAIFDPKEGPAALIAIIWRMIDSTK